MLLLANSGQKQAALKQYESYRTLLLEDLGDNTYTRVLAEGGDEVALYELALDLLVELHRRFKGDATLPPYDD